MLLVLIHEDGIRTGGARSHQCHSSCIYFLRRLLQASSLDEEGNDKDVTDLRHEETETVRQHSYVSFSH